MTALPSGNGDVDRALRGALASVTGKVRSRQETEAGAGVEAGGGGEGQMDGA